MWLQPKSPISAFLKKCMLMGDLGGLERSSLVTSLVRNQVFSAGKSLEITFSDLITLIFDLRPWPTIPTSCSPHLVFMSRHTCRGVRVYVLLHTALCIKKTDHQLTAFINCSHLILSPYSNYWVMHWIPTHRMLGTQPVLGYSFYILRINSLWECSK